MCVEVGEVKGEAGLTGMEGWVSVRWSLGGSRRGMITRLLDVCKEDGTKKVKEGQ